MHRLRAGVARLGEARMASMLGISRPTLARVLAGLDVQPTTMAVVQHALPGIQGNEGKGQ